MTRRTFFGLLAAAGFMLCSTGASPAAIDQEKKVRLIIDYNNGVSKHYDLPWASGMTVLDALKAAELSKPGIVLKYKGSGGTAFVEEIDGFRNEGTGTTGKNWLYWVNDQFGDQSCGKFTLNPSDVATWRFDVWKGKGEDAK